jgi:hypothetical protein
MKDLGKKKEKQNVKCQKLGSSYSSFKKKNGQSKNKSVSLKASKLKFTPRKMKLRTNKKQELMNDVKAVLNGLKIAQK